MNNNPLVSFCVKCYNQEELIRPALEAAFAQTYRPLEIVISDDASSDGSWNVIQTLVKGFREKIERGEIAGDVTVICNRNETNLGNLGNWQKCGELAHGELCIKADGDDISFPDRTACLVESWLRAGKERVKVISHAAYIVDLKGIIIGLADRSCAMYPWGAMMAWTRDCFSRFTKMIRPTSHDDIVFGIRALMLGEELMIHDKLVKYRIGSGDTSCVYNRRPSEIRIRKGLVWSYEQSLVDLQEIRPHLTDEQYSFWGKTLRAKYDESQVWCRLVLGENIFDRYRAYRQLLPNRKFCKERVLRFLWVLPKPIGDCITLPYYFCRFWSAKLRKRAWR